MGKQEEAQHTALESKTSPMHARFTVNGEIQCVACLIGFIFIIQH